MLRHCDGSDTTPPTAHPSETPCRTASQSGTNFVPSLSPATPPAASESIRVWVGSSPITLPSPLLTLILELRPLRSPGVTRLQRDYEPLRHPMWPSLSLAGVSWTVTRRHHRGFPCCVDPLGQQAIAMTPVRPRRDSLLGVLQQPCSPTAVLSRQGQEAHFPSRRRPSPSFQRVGSHMALFEAGHRPLVGPACTHVTAC